MIGSLILLVIATLYFGWIGFAFVGGLTVLGLLTDS